MKKWICRLLLPVVSKLENKMWREVYARKPRKKDWFDEFILVLLSIPIVMLGFAVWSDDPTHMEKMKLFFEYFSQLPFWYQTIFVGVIASVYGLKATDLIKRK